MYREKAVLQWKTALSRSRAHTYGLPDSDLGE